MHQGNFGLYERQLFSNKYVHKTERVQFQEFQKDKNSPQSRILQLDFCHVIHTNEVIQDEVQGILWLRNSINLFTAALFAHGKCDT